MEKKKVGETEMLRLDSFAIEGAKSESEAGIVRVKSRRDHAVPARVLDARAVSAVVLRSNPAAVEEVDRKRRELTERLDAVRADYRYWAGLFQSESAMLEFLERIKRRGVEMRAELESLPVYPTLRECGDDVLRDLVLMVHWVGTQINVGKELSAEQVATIADSIYDVYGHLRVEDVANCFRHAVILAAGPVQRLDTQVVMSWLRHYEEQRQQRALMRHELLHSKSKT
jgi:hypothetical protein